MAFPIWVIITLKSKMMRKSKEISKPQNSVYSFVVDGKCELWYLQLLKQHEKLNAKNINLEPKLPQKKKLEDQFNLAVKLSEESEKVFWVVDFDTILKETREAKKGSKTSLQEFQELHNKCDKNNNNIIVIINNPCLEYWFLQHFEQTSRYYETYSKIEKPLKKHLPDYEKTEKYYKNSRQNIYQKLKPHLPVAISNAEKLKEFNFENASTGTTYTYKIFNELNIKSK